MAAGRLRPARPDVAVLSPASAASSAADAAQPGEAFRHPVQRGARDHQQAEPADQREQRGRDPGGDRRDQRGRGEEADEAPGRLDRPRAVGRRRGAVRDVHQAEHAHGQRQPADDDPPGLRVPVRVPQVTPGEQGEQDRQQPGHRAEPAADHVGHQLAGDIVHVPPGGGGDDHGRAEEGEAEPSLRCIGSRSAALRPRPRAAKPAAWATSIHSAGEGPGEPPEQDQERVGGRLRPLRPAPAALVPAPALRRLALAPAGRPGVAAGPGARRGARGPWPGGRTALRACAALRHTAL